MSQTLWYYVDKQRQRQGPLSAQALIEAYERAELDGTSLIWREGLAQWQPLSQLAAELGLPTAPNDVGGVPPAPPQTTPAASAPMAADAGPATIVYAGFLRRWAALILDNLILGFGFYAVLIIVFMLIGLVGGFTTDTDEPPVWVGAVCLVLVLLYYVAAAGYYALQESGPHQATLGKRALGIKVTDLAGQRLSFSQALGRWAAAAISYLSFYIGFLMAAFTERKQALHDLIAGSLVVDRWAYSEYPERQQQGVSGCLIALLLVPIAGLFLIGILAAIAIPQFQDYSARAQTSEGVAIANGLKTQVEAAYLELNRCPTNADSGFQPAEDYAGNHLESATISESAPNRCMIEIRFGGAGAEHRLIGQTLVFEANTDDWAWECRGGTVPERLRPPACRAGASPP